MHITTVLPYNEEARFTAIHINSIKLKKPTTYCNMTGFLERDKMVKTILHNDRHPCKTLAETLLVLSTTVTANAYLVYHQIFFLFFVGQFMTQ